MKRQQVLSEYSSSDVLTMVAIPPALVLLYPHVLLALSNPDKYVIFPDEKGFPHLVPLKAPEPTLYDGASLNNILQDIEKITFTLYNLRDPLIGYELEIGNASSILNSSWDPELPTRIITHGWMSHKDSESCREIQHAYTLFTKSNVIIMDWSTIAVNVLYWNVADAVPLVAQRLTEFLNFMQRYGKLNPENTKLIGHSLGAHVVGLAARHAAGQIAEVVGLDPARPKFEDLGPGDRIDVTDASHVQIIHTNAGTLGMLQSIGTSDFYPNGGERQPGCGIDLFGKCAHGRSYLYFAESVIKQNGFPAVPLNKTQSYLNIPEYVYMGGPTLDPKACGSYTLVTNDEHPFALG